MTKANQLTLENLVCDFFALDSAENMNEIIKNLLVTMTGSKAFADLSPETREEYTFFCLELSRFLTDVEVKYREILERERPAIAAA